MDDAAIVSELDDLVGGDCYGPVSETVVASAEQELNLRFPRSYRLFLRHFGAAFCRFQICGLPNDTSMWGHVVVLSKMAWKGVGGVGMENHLIYVASNEGDIVYYIDTSIYGQDGENPIVAWGPESPGAVVGSTFLDFTRKLAAGLVD